MPPTVMQIVGYKNTGKTTLVERLTERLLSRGYKVGTAKHDAHRFDVDAEGTDTWRHRRAGARITAITSDTRTAIMEERPASLDELLRHMSEMDFVLVEGFKQERHAKIVIVRAEQDLELVSKLSRVEAVVCWLPDRIFDVPVFTQDDVDGLMNWLLGRQSANDNDSSALR